MSFPVPAGMMPSGTPVPASSWIARCTVPSPPATTTASVPSPIAVRSSSAGLGGTAPADDRGAHVLCAQALGGARRRSGVRATARGGVDQQGDVHSAFSDAGSATGGTSTPGFMMPRGSTRVLDGAQHGDAEFADLRLEVGPMVAPDRVVVGDGASRVADRAGCGILRPSPLAGGVGGEGGDDREVQRRSRRVHVGDVAQDDGLGAVGGQARGQGVGHGRLERARGSPRSWPSRASRRAPRCPAGCRAARARRSGLVPTNGRAPRRGAIAEWRRKRASVLSSAASRLRGVLALERRDGEAAARSGEVPAHQRVRPGLARVAQPQDGGTDAALREFAQRGRTRREVGKRPRAVGGRRGHRTDADGDLGDHAERALRPEEQLAQIGTGGARRGAAEPQLADGCRDAERVDEVVEAAVAARCLAARARRRVAADRGVLEALREVAERVAAGVQQLLGLRAGGAGAEGGQQRCLVEVPAGPPCARGRGR